MERASCNASERRLRGAVVAVSIDSKHRFSKTNRLSIILTAGLGVEGDAHYGRFVRHRHLARRNPKAPNLRQVHLIPVELFDVLWTSGYKVQPGDLGENITTVGLDLEKLPLDTVLRIGDSANIRLTGLRTPCVLIDRFKGGLKDRLREGKSGAIFRSGVMAVVLHGGDVDPGDPIRVVLPSPRGWSFRRCEFASVEAHFSRCSVADVVDGPSQAVTRGLARSEQSDYFASN